MGRVLVVLGTLLLLFVAYQLWGTGIYQARAQNDLRDQFQQELRRTRGPTSPTSPTTTSTTLPPLAVPEGGSVVARIVMPKIGVDQYVVQGVDVDDLRKGPGHYPATQLPGHEGNTAIAGHRTTYGAPFGSLDQLAAGDEIRLTTIQGTFVYKVTEQRVIDPSEVGVLDATPDPTHAGHDLSTVTLTTCNPKYSAAQRLVVKGSLELPETALPLPPIAVPDGRRATSINGLSGETSSRTPAAIWGLVAAVVGLLWWLWFHRHPSWRSWLLGAVPFLAVLFVFYTFLERLLPSNY